VARRRQKDLGRIEPPEWYRNFHLAAWDELDGQEQRMIDGQLGGPAPLHPGLHEIHALRRWHEAKHAYRGDHPEFARQEYQDLFVRSAERRAGYNGG
jgi:hypothetical protein